MRTRTTVAMAFCRFLQERGIRYCVVGDAREFPSVVKAQVDLIVDEPVMAMMPAEIGVFCDRYETRLVQYVERQNACCYTLSWPVGEGRNEYLAFSIGGDYCRDGRRLLASAELLATSEQALDARGRLLEFMIPCAALGFIYCLVKRIYALALDDAQAQFLFEQWRRNPDAAARQIARLWGNTPEARLLTRAAEANDWSVVRCILPRLRRVLQQRRPFSLRAWCRERWRRSLRELRPSGVWVTVTGSDELGKKALRQAARVIDPMFREHRILYRRPRLISTRRADHAAHSSPATTKHRSALKSLLLRADHALGYWCRMRKLLVRSTAVLSSGDDGVRTYVPAASNSLHTGVRKLWEGLLPRPELHIVLSASATATASIETLPAAGGQRFKIIPTETSAELTAVRIASAITDFMAERTARRMDRIADARNNPAHARWLLFCCRHRVPLLGALTRVLFNSDISAKLPRDVSLPHPYGIVVHPKAVIGRRVTLMQGVTLAEKAPGADSAPVVENGVYIGAGAKILGPVRVGAGAVIGANAVVTRDVPAHMTVVGVNRVLERSIANVTAIEEYLDTGPPSDQAASSAAGIAADTAHGP